MDTKADQLVITLFAAALGGIVARRLRVPGGVPLGAMVSSAIANGIIGSTSSIPLPVSGVVFILLGSSVGATIRSEMLKALRAALFPALVSATLLIACGIGVAQLLRTLGMSPPGDVLATSPGGLSVLSAAAAEQGVDPTAVAVFHTVRLVIILLSLPALVSLSSKPPHYSAVGRDSEDMHGGAASERALRRQPKGSGTALCLLVSAACAILAHATGVPSGLMLGAMTGTALFAVIVPTFDGLPNLLTWSASVGIGWIIGTRVGVDSVLDMGIVVQGAILSSILLILAGLVIAQLLRAARMAPPGDMMATSPGMMEVLALEASQRRHGAMEVTLFHAVRMILVVASLPLLTILYADA